MSIIAVTSSESLRAALDLGGLIQFMHERHKEAKGEIADALLGPPERRYLVRSATGQHAVGSKLVTVIPGNERRGYPSVQAIFALFDGETGRPMAVMDATEMTYWKTAADSALGSLLLSRPDARVLLMCGAGNLAPWLVRAHRIVRPSIEKVLVWNRTPEKARAFAAQLNAEGIRAEATDGLEAAVRGACIISTATMAVNPFLKGEWLQPGQHLDLVGGFTAEMREADDACVARARVFVDCYDTAFHGVGDILGPIASGVLARKGILADLYELAAGAPGRTSAADITFFKNAGGAHLDLMTAEYLLSAQSHA